MISEKQLEANRRNAQHSTGPKSPEGKECSRFNALRHNLTGQVTAMADPDRLAYNKFAADLIQSLKPENAIELQLAQRIATDSWRLNRAAAIEDNMYATGLMTRGGESGHDNPQIDDALTAAKVFTREAHAIQLLSLYEQRLNRTIQKNLALLKSLQTERKAQHAAGMEEARRLLQLSEMRNLPYDPAKDGFVFSVNEIHHSIDLHRRMDQGRRADFRHFKPRKFAVAAA